MEQNALSVDLVHLYVQQNVTLHLSLIHIWLYVVGELLDVDGTCGGYNLQWAFTSGYIAASQIGRQ